MSCKAKTVMKPELDPELRIKTHRSLLIEEPGLQTITQQLTSASIGTACWILWSKAWLPLATVLLWILSGELAFIKFIQHNALFAFVDALPWYILIVDILAGSLILWAIININRFRGKEKRKFAKTMTLEEQTLSLGLSLHVVKHIQEGNRFIAYHNEDGNVIDIQSTKLTPSSPNS